MPKTRTVTITRPDDWHVHLREGAVLAAVLPFTARVFARAIVMPNLERPVTTLEAARAYRERILAALPRGAAFEPLMTCYLTDDADAAEVARGYRAGVFAAAKLYPAGATTLSAAGVTDMARLAPVFERMQREGMPLLIHGEVADADVDMFDREAVFIDKVLAPLVRDFPSLRVVLEHVTTEEAVDFVRETGDVAATITAHHLVINRNALFDGGLRPHHYCRPVPKRERHRLALREAATSGEACFFLGTDSAPHTISAKEGPCGAAGVFTAPAALALYTQVFDEEDALDKLDAFAGRHGPEFYGVKPNAAKLTLVREDWTVPESVAVSGGGAIRPFLAGGTATWRVGED